AARARRAGQVGVVLHVRARGSATGLRSGDRHLRRPRRRHPAGRDCRRSSAHPRRLRPAARRGRCRRAGEASQQRGGDAMIAQLRRQAWVLGLCVLFILLLVVTRLIQPDYGADDFGSLVRAALPYGFAVAAQTVVVIAGGIDLSVASMMALTSV